MTSKRQHLLDAAEALFAERGYGNTQISEIARVASTGISTFYRYFDSKEALLAVLLEDLFGPMAHNLRDHRAGIEALSPPEQIARIRQTFDVVFDALLDRPKLVLTLFTSGFGASAAVSAMVERELDALACDLVTDLERAEAYGLVVISDKLAFAKAIIGVFLHLAYDHLRTGVPTREAAIDSSVRMTLGGLVTFATPAAQQTIVPMLRYLVETLRETDT
ncbi:MAG: TetR/AcrR family transcriptional regulator [Deltaproteobacteria bacterium]|nr:TetR/AcrR family transcriptional regulator [Deltaproteobacteria bacterium]